MTRRDRAAMTLALEWARTHPGRGGGPVIATDEAIRALRVGRDFARGIGDCVARVRLPGETSYRRRLLRARLALYLRAVLRADKGDYGGARCSGCRCSTRNERAIVSGWCSCCEANATWTRRRWVPLWERIGQRWDGTAWVARGER